MSSGGKKICHNEVWQNEAGEIVSIVSSQAEIVLKGNYLILSDKSKWIVKGFLHNPFEVPHRKARSWAGDHGGPESHCVFLMLPQGPTSMLETKWSLKQEKVQPGFRHCNFPYLILNQISRSNIL